jgi:hypothetical protein
MNCGKGTNTKGDLLALWVFAYIKQVPRLQLVGDSKVIIDWFTNDNNLQLISLQPWMTKIRSLNGHFQQIKAQHIYRTYNQDVDRFSKETLLLDEDDIYFSKESEGHHEIFERFDINP